MLEQLGAFQICRVSARDSRAEENKKLVRTVKGTRLRSRDPEAHLFDTAACIRSGLNAEESAGIQANKDCLLLSIGDQADDRAVRSWCTMLCQICNPCRLQVQSSI